MHVLWGSAPCWAVTKRSTSNGSATARGVEGEIGRFRRRHLVPVPKVASLADLND